jgi:hypothetical protein
MLSENLWKCTISIPKARRAYVLPTTQVRAITRRAHGRSLAAFKSHPLSENGEHWTELYLPYFAEIQGKFMICFKAVAMIRKYLLVCKKYPHRKSHFVQNTGLCIPTYVNILKASNFSLNLIGLNVNFWWVLRAGENCLLRAQAKECEELANILICLECRCLSSKCYYKRRSLNVVCQNIGYFVQRWEYMQFMPCMKCQFGFVADFVEVNCKGNWKLWSNCLLCSSATEHGHFRLYWQWKGPG